VVASLILASFCAAAAAETKEAVAGLIPAPKHCDVQAGDVPVAAQGKPNLVILTPEKPDKKETLAAKWLVREIATLSGVAPQIATGTASPAAGLTALVLATFNRETENRRQAMALLDDSDRKLLADPQRSEQAYVIRTDGNPLAIVGGSAQGTLYGAMTLLQLLQTDGGRVTLPRVHVRDWPDFRYRIAENWTYTEGREHWGRGWCYDWGDGAENYRKRLERLFDRCLRYKVNMICFSSGFGESFSKMWSGSAFPIQKELNQLADERGIKLMIGGYGIACGDNEMLNRTSYPDGKEYLCLTTGNMGNCRSNDELTRRIQDRFRQYVQETEPRALYIHHEDSDTYASAEWLWKHRCDQCRTRWPNEAMAAADGAAGAFVHGYNALCDAIFSVKNADSGYDAARDCLVILVSPTYTSSREPDATWDKQRAYWTVASQLLKHKDNVCIAVREQFLRNDNHKRRILEMAETLRRDAQGHGLFLFFVSRASLYEMGPLFVPVPAAMSKLNEGAEVAYYMCGKIFQEPQILMNAAHMWNTGSLGVCELPARADACLSLYNQLAHRRTDPPQVFGEDGFLRLACRVLYGPKAGRHMEKVYAMTTSPICYARHLYVWGLRSALYYDWAPELKVTQEAIVHVQAALGESDCRPENRVLLERFLKCLGAGERFARIRLAYQNLVPLAFSASSTADDMQQKAALIEEQMRSMEQYLKEQFTTRWATPRGGDAGCWSTNLAEMRQELNRNVQQWTGALRARQLADRQEAAGGAPAVVNGGMEDATGWSFVRVTGDEEVGYADGGYVTDKTTRGKRAYRIRHLPVNRVSDKWPMPVRTTWGEIVQELRVQPGQRYAVAFEVFNNYGYSRGPGLLEHQVLIDDQAMWSLDASAPQGWKSGGFFFTAKTPGVRLRLRTTDVRPVVGWQQGEGDSWWDNVRAYPVEPEAPTSPKG